jgi:hypothetical protein
MITGILIFGAIMAFLGIGAHATGLPHLFYIIFLPLAKVLAAGIVIGILFYGCATGHFPN